MPVTNEPHGIVIVNQHEDHGEVATRLLELAEEKGHDARTVEAQRGEHDAPLSFRVPTDVAEAFNSDRAERWPAPDGDTPAGNDTNAPAARQARPGKATRE